jgi:hypothetical protein
LWSRRSTFGRDVAATGALAQRLQAEGWLRPEVMAAAGMVSLPLTTSLAASFDGNWDVVVICPAEPNGAKAFTLRYKAEVKNGVLHGQYGTKDQPGSQSIDGQIEPNGTAMPRWESRGGVQAKEGKPPIQLQGKRPI